jgi:hypothetical protein
VGAHWNEILEHSETGSRVVYRVAKPTEDDLLDVAVRGGLTYAAGTNGLLVVGDSAGWRELRQARNLLFRRFVESEADLYLIGAETLDQGPASHRYTIYQVLGDRLKEVHSEARVGEWTDVRAADGALWILGGGYWMREIRPGQSPIVYRFDCDNFPTLMTVRTRADITVYCSGGNIAHFDGQTWSIDASFRPQLGEMADDFHAEAAMQHDSAGNVWLAGNEGSLVRHEAGGGWKLIAYRSVPWSLAGVGSQWHLQDLSIHERGDQHTLWMAGANDTIASYSYRATPLESPSPRTATIWPDKHVVLLPLVGPDPVAWP